MARQPISTEAEEKVLPPLYLQESDGMEATVYAKWFSPYSRWKWLATRRPRDYGYTLLGLDPAFDELGYFSLDELEAATVEIGSYQLPAVERDEYFRPAKLAEIVEAPERH